MITISLISSKRFISNLIVSLILIISAQIAHAIPKAYMTAEQQTGYPSEIIYAVALAESGKSVNGKYRPWPWTLTYQAKPFYFDNKNELVNKINHILKSHDTNETLQLGIGLMQIEWRYHKERFSSIDDAVNPYINLNVGLKILQEYEKEKGNLWDAIGRYHSGNQEYAVKYQRRVAKMLVNHVLGGQYEH